MVLGMTNPHVVNHALALRFVACDRLGKAGFRRTIEEGNCFRNFTFIQASFSTEY